MIAHIDYMSDTSNIPNTLHEQLSRAGKKGAKKLTNEARSLGGKRSWQTRLKKAREAERKQNEEATTETKNENRAAT